MFSDSDDDLNETGFYFWNNWKPPKHSVGNSLAKSVNPTFKKTVCCNSWLPPVTFGLRRKQRDQLTEESINPEKVVSSELVDNFNEWGLRIAYGSSYNDIEENELVWNIFHIGVFGVFKLEKNNFGKMIAFAEAEVDNGAYDAKAILQIDNEQHLRKLLGVSLNEWYFLIEAMGSSKFVLKYEALTKRPVNLSVGEKLWWFLCKRRHYLPNVALRLRRRGAKKMPQLFNIFPKFRVEAIQTFDGRELD